MPTLELETTIHAPIERVFDLARSVDAHLETMADHDESAIERPSTDLLSEGDHVTWRARYFGLHLEMTVEISDCQRPTFFRDELVSSPFAELRHDHHFTAVSSDVTRLCDEFSFSSPGGPVGTLVDRAYLDRYMRELLAQRNARLKRVAETGEWKSFLE
ncbi:SRPBCC family protein [Natrinema sp. SYSU A 869]|uniref:SRPBCC family protein n=1 Tax=Natrinema sp. SYSU A 869 TaxID=2871694 RepID=UPI001CA3A44A|nr:SRPBCC family protein [Natrinema sp. SYSU A 869]